jgi:hypothetical protein
LSHGDKIFRRLLVRRGALRVRSRSHFYGQLPLPRLSKGECGAYDPAIGLPAAALTITGKVKYHDSKADSGNTLSRGFCPECGARLFGKASAMPDLALITAGSLDDPSQYTPSMDIFTVSAQPWDHMNPALAKFPKMPM